MIKTIKEKINNIRSEELKEIFKESNFILLLIQPKNLYKELISAKFLSSNIYLKKPGTSKCNDSRCKVCQIYLNTTDRFVMSNKQVWEIRKDIDCHSINVIYYLKCLMRNYEIYIEKTVGNNVTGFKGRINKHISESKTGVSTCKFPRHVYSCGKNNNCLKEPFFTLNIMLRLNNSDKLEFMEKHFHLKDYDTMSNPSRINN